MDYKVDWLWEKIQKQAEEIERIKEELVELRETIELLIGKSPSVEGGVK